MKQKAKELYSDIYEVIITGIKWYIKFFGTDFPWEKYDQIFWPEFKYGAMENVGAVTISENYIPHDKPTIYGVNSLQNTIEFFLNIFFRFLTYFEKSWFQKIFWFFWYTIQVKKNYIRSKILK